MTANSSLTLKDKALTKTFYEWTKQNGVEYFSSDDFRRCRLNCRNPDKPKQQMTLYDLFEDPQHEIGALIFKWKFHGFVKSGNGEIASVVPSNNCRKVDVWRWHHRVEGWLNSPLMESFISRNGV